MAARRLVLFAVAAITAATLPASASAESLGTCAQRVIRDWYSGGRVDRVYPLACYRAAIKALPTDVLQYSNADRDIARAMAFARRGLRDPGNKAPAKRPETTSDPAPPPAASAPTKSPRPRKSSAGVTSAEAPDAVRSGSEPVRLASGAEPAAQGAPLPYPVIVLGALACILLASGAVSWLAARRR